MTEQEVRKQMEEGFSKVQPKVADMTSTLMDCYQEGFRTCWKLLTGQNWV